MQGQAITEKIEVDDPVQVWVLRNRQGLPQVVIDGKPLIDRINELVPFAAPYPEAVQSLQDLRTALQKFEASKDLNTIVADIVALNNLRKAKKDLGGFDAVTAGRRTLAEDQQKVSAPLRALARQIAKTLHLIAVQGRVGDSGLKIVTRGQHVRFVTIKVGTATKVVPIYGVPQTTQTPGHAAKVLATAINAAKTGNYEYLTLDLSWRTATGRLPKASDNRPDVIGVRIRDNVNPEHTGQVDAWEVASRRDDPVDLQKKLDDDLGLLPVDRQGKGLVVSP